MRDWRMYWAKACMTAWWRSSIHAVVRAMDMNGHLSDPPGLTPIETSQRDRTQAMTAAQSSARTMLAERPDEETAMSASPGRDWD